MLPSEREAVVQAAALVDETAGEFIRRAVFSRVARLQKRATMTTPDCKSCGACCLGDYDDGRGFADCTIADVKRMSRAIRARLVREATPARMSPKWGKTCAFLRGKPGNDVSCQIYETRPGVCRAFRPGSRRCMDARAAAGFGAGR